MACLFQQFPTIAHPLVQYHGISAKVDVQCLLFTFPNLSRFCLVWTYQCALGPNMTNSLICALAQVVQIIFCS